MTCAPVNSLAIKRGRKKLRRGRPKDADLKLRRCEEILCRASQVFAQFGYQNTDVQLIADPLGVSKGTIYRYFPTKEKLFLAAVERGVSQLDEHVAAARSRESEPLQQIGAMIRAYLEFFEKHPLLAELFIQERAEFRSRRKSIYFEKKEEAQESCRAMVKELIGAGRLRNIPVERVTGVMGDLLYGTMFTNFLTGRRRSFDQQAADILDVMFNGILSEGERKTQ
jgi:AcrR family transcriptional regulator